MANLFQPSLSRVTDSNGDPVSGAKMFFYLTGTTTPETWFTDHGGDVAGVNPLTADSSGQFVTPAYLDPTTIYRIRLTEADGTTLVWPDLDNVGELIAGSEYIRSPYDYGATGGYATIAAAKTGVDDTLAIQALLAAWTADPFLVPDFSGRYWTVTDTIRFEQDQLHTAAHFIAGHFVALNDSTGGNLIEVSLRYGSWAGKLGAFGNGGTIYGSRGWHTGIFMDNTSRINSGPWVAENFKRDGMAVIDTDAGENNIASMIGAGRAVNCGSALGQPNTLLLQDFTAVSRTGSSGSLAQRTVLTMDADVPSEIEVDDTVFFDSEPYIVMGISGSELTVFPWVTAAAESTGTGTLTYGHGAGLALTGGNTASCDFGIVEGFRCGSVISAAGLYTGKFQGVQSQVSGCAFRIGNPITSASWGGQIGYFHAESTVFDLIGVSTSPYRIDMPAPSAMGTQTSGTTGELFGQSTQIAPRLTDDSFNSSYSTFKGVTLRGEFSPVPQRVGPTRAITSSTVDLSNYPHENHVVQKRTTTSLRLTWYDELDRVMAGYNYCSAVLFGSATGDGPGGTTTITLNSGDQAAGVTVNGGTTVEIPSSTHPLFIYAVMDNPSTKEWLVRWAVLKPLPDLSGVSAPAGGATVDAEARTVISDILTALQS